MVANTKTANSYAVVALDALTRVRTGDNMVATYTQVMANALVGMTKTGEFGSDTVKAFNGKAPDDLKAWIKGAKLALLGEKASNNGDRSDAGESAKQARINDERRVERAAALAFIAGKLADKVTWNEKSKCIEVKDATLFLSNEERRKWEPTRNKTSLIDGKSFLVQDSEDKLKRVNRSIVTFMKANDHLLPKSKAGRQNAGTKNAVTIEKALDVVKAFAKQPQSKDSRAKLQPLAALLFAAFDRNDKLFLAAAHSNGDDGIDEKKTA